MTAGAYEKILLAALQAMHEAPWSLSDLVQAESAMTEDVCGRISQTCDSAAVRDWLKTLPDEEREDLLQRLNTPGAISNVNGS